MRCRILLLRFSGQLDISQSPPVQSKFELESKRFLDNKYNNNHNAWIGQLEITSKIRVRKQAKAGRNWSSCTEIANRLIVFVVEIVCVLYSTREKIISCLAIALWKLFKMKFLALTLAPDQQYVTQRIKDWLPISVNTRWLVPLIATPDSLTTSV